MPENMHMFVQETTKNSSSKSNKKRKNLTWADQKGYKLCAVKEFEIPATIEHTCNSSPEHTCSKKQ